MNFNYLVRAGTYSEKLLTAEDKQFIDGMRFAMKQIEEIQEENEQIATDENSSLRERLESEMAADTITGLLAHLETCVSAEIVSMIDSYDRTEDEIKKEEPINPIKKYGKVVTVHTEYEKKSGVPAKKYELTGGTRTIFGRPYVSAKNISLDPDESAREYWIPAESIIGSEKGDTQENVEVNDQDKKDDANVSEEKEAEWNFEEV